MNDTTRTPSVGAFTKVKRAIQWMTFGILALFAVAVATELRKAGAPGAPLTLLYITIAAVVALALAHLPPIFGRLPRKAQWGAYASIFAVIVLFGFYLSAMDPVWEKTPQGVKEAAAREEYAQRAVEERAKEDARREAKELAKAQADAEAKQASLDAQKPEVCRTLASQATDGQKILEINNVEVAFTTAPGESLTCMGDAITAVGVRKIEFGLIVTPQGKELFSTRFP